MGSSIGNSDPRREAVLRAGVPVARAAGAQQHVAEAMPHAGVSAAREDLACAEAVVPSKRFVVSEGFGEVVQVDKAGD